MKCQIGPLAVNASFQFVDVRDLGTVDSLLISAIGNRFSMILWSHNDSLSQCALPMLRPAGNRISMC